MGYLGKFHDMGYFMICNNEIGYLMRCNNEMRYFMRCNDMGYFLTILKAERTADSKIAIHSHTHLA
jgi:hypothetical protein